jgi:hypothetical protein
MACADGMLYAAAMASRRLRAEQTLSRGVWWLFAAVAACGPSVDPGATTGTTQANPDGTTDGAPTSSGSGTSSGTDPTASTAETTTSGTSSTGAVSVGSSSTSTGETGSSTTTGEAGSSSSSTDIGTDTSTDTGEPGPCQAPDDCEPIFFDDPQHKLTDLESGWVTCHEGGVIYREEAVDCAHEVFWPKCEGQGGECASDADCPGDQACANIYGDCGCVAQCMSDSECGDGEICLCAGGHPDLPATLYIKNTCLPAQCATKADCAGECGCRGDDFCGFTVSAFCPTLTDECDDHGDCQGDAICSFDQVEARWRCLPGAICE